MTIELRDIVKAFGSRVVVDHLDLVVEDGGFTVLLGPSGCGKTTTLRMIAGLDSPQAGDIVLNGETVTALSPKARRVAMVFQDYGLYPHMSVVDNVGFPLKIAGIVRRERDERARAMLQRLRIDHLAERRPGRISGGEKQRVSLARALVRKPSVLLMDEPLSNLDALLRASMRAEIKTLHQELGTTTLYVTHDQIEAMSLGTAIAVMRNGRVEQYGPPAEIYNRPATLFVGRFVGTPSLNVLPVRLERQNGVLWLTAPDVRLPVPPASIFDSAGFPSDGQLLLGIRPEHFAVGPSTDGQGARGIVRIVEPLGQDQYLHVAVGEATLVVRTSPERSFAVGEAIGLMPTGGRMHFFDPRSEMRV